MSNVPQHKKPCRNVKKLNRRKNWIKFSDIYLDPRHPRNDVNHGIQLYKASRKYGND